jgi:putative glutamine amidotransferase
MPTSPNRRPRIAVTGPDAGGWASWICTRALIWWEGGRAVRVTPAHPCSLLGCDGLVISGGADVAPEYYQETVLATIKHETQRRHHFSFRFLISILLWLLRKVSSVKQNGNQDLERDKLELRLLTIAMERQLPVLGICRGAQLLNVFLGGSLYQDIHGFYKEHPQLRTILARKRIQIVKGTCLNKIFGRTRAKVNSLHRQSVKTLGRDLRVAAMEPNGVVQAIECTRCPFVLGVQWHPEFLPFYRSQRRIFSHLIHAAGEAFVRGRPRFVEPQRKLILE